MRFSLSSATPAEMVSTGGPRACHFAGVVQSRQLSLAATQGNPADFFQHPAPLGSNLYDRDRVRAQIPAGRGVAVSDQVAQAEAAAALTAAEAQEAAAEERQEGASQVGSCWHSSCVLACREAVARLLQRTAEGGGGTGRDTVLSCLLSAGLGQGAQHGHLR